jgi:hypothetical protein
VEHARQFNPKEGSDMRAQPVILSFAISIGCGIAASPAFSQENRGTFEQQMACTPDVFRLCGELIPDANRITVCLRQNTSQLSNPCRAVFESNASTPQPATPRGRNVQPRPYNNQRLYNDQSRPDDDQ